MKKFNSKKRIYISKFKIILLGGIILIIFTNNILSQILNNSNKTTFYKILITNIYGDLINEYQSLTNLKKVFYKNILGFNINDEENQEVSKVKEEINIEIKKPLVYLYNTYQTDKYKVNYYSSYTVSPTITQASFILKEYLEDYGIKALVEENSVAEVLKTNDISYFTSYRASRILLEKAKEKNESLKYFLDIQMLDTTDYLVNGDYAEVLFVIGLKHDNYLNNEKFAISLNNLLESEPNNISKGISLRGGNNHHGIYNQDFSSNALLIQIGGKKNSIREVNNTLKILAKVLATHIKEES